MPLVLKDRVKEVTTTTGTGAYTLSGAVIGYQSFSVIGNGNTTYYAVTNGVDWEVGIGTYSTTGPTLSRTLILESSNSNAAVNWNAGNKEVFVTYPADRAITGSSSALELPNPGTANNLLVSDGSNWVSSLPKQTIDSRNTGFTVDATGLGKIFSCTGSSTVLLTAAATLGAGFYCWIWNANTSTGNIVIDPNGAETIDGVSTLILYPNEGTQIICTGTNWVVGDEKTTRMYSENAGSSNARAFAGGQSSVAIGSGTTLSSSSMAIGLGFPQADTYGKFAYANVAANFANAGDVQHGKYILYRTTTNNTPSALTVDGAAPTGSNTLLLTTSGSAYAVFGLLVVKRIGTNVYSAWRFDGLVARPGTAASTVALGFTNSTISNAGALTAPAYSADTTFGGLTITVTGQTGVSFRWAATVFTTEIRNY